MHKILSNQLWDRVGAVARKSKQRQAAIAYVTSDLVGFKRGDILIVDASEPVIRAGGTNAKLLLKLARKGVMLYCCPGLHAKVLLLDDIAVLGSNNMSESSRATLVEAAIMTDEATAVSGVASLIEQLKRQSVPLNDKALLALSKIEVVRHGFVHGVAKEKRKKVKISELGTQTWLIGVEEEDRESTESEKRMIDHSQQILAEKHKTSNDSIEWIRWSATSPFALKAQTGDQAIQVWRQNTKRKRPSVVLRATPVLLKEQVGGSTFVFIKDSKGKHAEMKWGAFKLLMKRLGYRRKIGPGSQVILDPDLADGIIQNWKTV